MLEYDDTVKGVRYVIEEDLAVGYYLIIYENRDSNKSNFDYLYDSLEDIFEDAKERFGIKEDMWRDVLKE